MEEKKILIVDDEPEILETLKDAFDFEGFTAITAGSAEEALDILKQEKIMVMFFDLKLPGMSGIDLCKHIRKDYKTAVIYALTGYADSSGLVECRKAGFDDFFAKPVALQTLLKAAKYAFEKIERWKMPKYELP